MIEEVDMIIGITITLATLGVTAFIDALCLALMTVMPSGWIILFSVFNISVGVILGSLWTDYAYRKEETED